MITLTLVSQTKTIRPLRVMVNPEEIVAIIEVSPQVNSLEILALVALRGNPNAIMVTESMDQIRKAIEEAV